MSSVSDTSSVDRTGVRPYFRTRRIGHVNLWVSDLKTSEKFYHEVSGLSVEFSEPDLVATFLGTGHTPHDLGMIEVTGGVDRYGKNGLLQLPGTIGLSPGLNHLAWELDNERDLVEAYERLSSAGIKTDITVDHQVAHSIYMFDPDGNYNEFYCDTIKDWRSVLGGPMELITSHWDPLSAEGFSDSRYDESPTVRVVETAPVHPQRLTHAVLHTENLPALEQFYTSVGGLEVVMRLRHRDREVVYLNGGLNSYSYNLVLVGGDKTCFGNSSFELASEEALQQAITKLKVAGAEIVHDVSLPWKRAFFLKDPDSLLSEYYVRRSGDINLVEAENTLLELSV